MKIQIKNRCQDFSGYRASRVKSMFNCSSGCDFRIDAEIPDESEDWKIGVVVGPSGSGKTSIGKALWPEVGIYNGDEGWDKEKPIVECVSPNGDFNDVTGAFAAVGLGSVPSWLRPYHVLSNGEKFRAGLARLIAEKRQRVIVDEFTSVVDRQVAKVGAFAFSKSWKRNGGKAVLLSCHYDVLDWVEPDWIFDTKTATLERGCLRRRPKFGLEIFKTNSSYWRLFEPHHYLKLPLMVAASYYVGFVDGEAVCHIGVSPKLESGGMRASRMVVMPEWQGAGVGLRFLNAVCEMQFTEVNKFHSRVSKVFFHTSHPGLVAALVRDKRWIVSSQMLGGAHKGRSEKSIRKAGCAASAGYGGHNRGVVGFKYLKRS